LALDKFAVGDEEGGWAFQRETLEIYRDALGEQNPDTVVAVGGRRLDPDFDPPSI